MEAIVAWWFGIRLLRKLYRKTSFPSSEMRGMYSISLGVFGTLRLGSTNDDDRESFNWELLKGDDESMVNPVSDRTEVSNEVETPASGRSFLDKSTDASIREDKRRFDMDDANSGRRELRRNMDMDHRAWGCWKTLKAMPLLGAWMVSTSSPAFDRRKMS